MAVMAVAPSTDCLSAVHGMAGGLRLCICSFPLQTHRRLALVVWESGEAISAASKGSVECPRRNENTAMSPRLSGGTNVPRAPSLSYLVLSLYSRAIKWLAGVTGSAG